MCSSDLERFFKTTKERQGLQNQVDHRRNVIARDFERVCAVLAELHYIEGETADIVVTTQGQMLKSIHSESELLISEGIRRHIFEGLGASELAAVLSALVYESRRDDQSDGARLPHGPTEQAIRALFTLWAEIQSVEAKHKLSTVRKPDAGFAWCIYRWANGGRLSGVLHDTDLSAGDFVRTTRRLIDVLEQLAAVSDVGLRETAFEAIDLVRRGIVSAAELED